jgi:hypothetical protein
MGAGGDGRGLMIADWGWEEIPAGLVGATDYTSMRNGSPTIPGKAIPMDGTKRKPLMIAGIVLMLGLLFFPILTATMVYESPRYYFSTCTVEMPAHWESINAFEASQHTPDPSPNPDTCMHDVQAAMAPFGSAGEYRKVPQTDLWELGIWDRSPMDAAMKANEAAIALQTSSSVKVKIWEMAEPALAPVQPRVVFDMSAGLGLGFLSFVAGALVWIKARWRSYESPEGIG